MSNKSLVIDAFQTSVAWTRHLKQFGLTIQEAGTLVMLQQPSGYQAAGRTIASLTKKGLVSSDKGLTEKGSILAERLLEDPGPDTMAVPESTGPLRSGPTVHPD